MDSCFGGPPPPGSPPAQLALSIIPIFKQDSHFNSSTYTQSSL